MRPAAPFGALLALALGLPALGQAQATKTVDELIAILHSGTPVERYRAASDVERLGPAAVKAAPALAANLNHPVRDVSSRAARALGRMGRPALPTLRAALASEDPEIRGSAAIGIASMNSAAAPAVDDLIRALRDPHAEVRNRATYALGAVGQPGRRAIPALFESATFGPPRDDPASWWSGAAAYTLYRLANEDELVARLDDPHPRVRETAAVTLGIIRKNQPKAAVALLPLVNDPDPGVRRAATNSLGQVYPVQEEALEVLAAAAAGWWPSVDRRIATGSLQSVGKALRSRGVTAYWVVPRVHWQKLTLVGALLLAWFVGCPWLFRKRPRAPGPKAWTSHFVAVLSPALVGTLVTYVLIVNDFWVAPFLPDPPIGVLPAEVAGGLTLSLCSVLAALWTMTRMPRQDPAAIRDAMEGMLSVIHELERAAAEGELSGNGGDAAPEP